MHSPASSVLKIFLHTAMFLVACLNSSLKVSASNPGIQLRLSNKGLSYAANVALEVLIPTIRTVSIPNQVGKASTSIGSVDYEVTQTRITEFTSSSTSLVVSPSSGLTWRLDGVRVEVRGNWLYKYKRYFIRVQDHGTYEGSISQSSIIVSVSVGMDTTSGRLTLRSTACNCQIDSLSLRIQGGAGWLYNLFIKQIERPLKNRLQDVICERARLLIDETGRSELDSMQYLITVEDKWMFDYRLTSPPVFQSEYIEFFFKGQFSSKDDNSATPFQPKPIQMMNAEQMVDICISDYVFNSLWYTLYRQGVLNYYLTKEDLPVSDQNFLSTNCKGVTCIVTAFASIGRLYPNSFVELEMVATDSPQTLITEKGIRSNFTHVITYRARLSDGSLVYLLKTNVSVSLGLKPELTSTTLKSNVTGLLPYISVADSAIGQVSDAPLQAMFKIVSRILVLPKLNKICQKGIPLPNLKKVQLINHKLITQENCLKLTTDILYSH